MFKKLPVGTRPVLCTSLGPVAFLRRPLTTKISEKPYKCTPMCVLRAHYNNLLFWPFVLMLDIYYK